MSKIGVGVITCNRTSFLEKCLQSIPLDVIDHLVIINDGEPLPKKLYRYNIDKVDIIDHSENLGVGKSKNDAFTFLLNNKKCDHIFLIEDDIVVADDTVFEKYIECAEITGLHHLMFGYHGPANKAGRSKGKPTPRKIIDYGKVQLALNQHCVGAFCYYTSRCLQDVGLYDEKYLNAFEHVDHSYMLAKEGYCTPYWWWPDVANSYELLDELACSEDSSTIRPREDWQDNIKKSAIHFTKKHGVSPAWQNAVPDTDVSDVVNFLRKLKK